MWLGCLVGGAATIVILALIGGAVFTMFFAMATMGGAGAAVTKAGVALQELTISGELGDPKVAVIPVYGVLVRDAGTWDEDPVLLLRAMLRAARDDKNVKGVILSVDSGGGGITTCDLMRKEIIDYRQETNNPVVTLMEDVAASGAYYVACGTDHVLAHPTTITGSIGVMFPLFDASGLLDKVGVRDRTVKTGEFKNIGSPFAEKTEEQWQREKDLLANIVQQMHERFVQIVAEGRDLDVETVRSLADGRIYTSQEALDNGLIDGIGYHDDAVEKVKLLAGLADAHVMAYQRVPSVLELLLGLGGREVKVRLDGAMPTASGELPMYLWSPAMQ